MQSAGEDVRKEVRREEVHCKEDCCKEDCCKEVLCTEAEEANGKCDAKKSPAEAKEIAAANHGRSKQPRRLRFVASAPNGDGQARRAD